MKSVKYRIDSSCYSLCYSEVVSLSLKTRRSVLKVGLDCLKYWLDDVVDLSWDVLSASLRARCLDEVR